ncbi:MAG: hypothetical protein WCO03_00145 [bacterium]
MPQYDVASSGHTDMEGHLLDPEEVEADGGPTTVSITANSPAAAIKEITSDPAVARSLIVTAGHAA